ncbi:MAG: TRAP transporter fused permease subunit [Sulfolobales archaeon]|nr:TRAP transporter fused permease subunit [Sulfolobales archaeon]MCX8186966.1 TRAP transporter fused permease subunit [Sulfolobales archaeon]MDW7969282.1 TRAP transporter fused permease subunit [Sulfolobales archaeon]
MPRRTLSKWNKLLVESALCIMAIYNIYKLLFTTYDVYEHMVVTLLFSLPLTFIMFSSTKKDINKVPWYDYLLAILALITVADIYLNYSGWFFRRMWLVTPLTTEQIVIGSLLIAFIIETARRTSGVMFTVLIGVFIGYLLLAPYLPGIGFRTNPLRVIEYLYLTPYGIFSTPLEVMSTYVIAFTLLGAAFSMSGTGEFFINLANAFVGRSSGGPAKVSVIASSLFGSISGSAVANVYATGVLTIPTMKSVGFPPYLAGAVEAVASTGGQIMPPVMGAAAFVMAELLGTHYGKIMIAAIVPAIIYYLGVYVQVHYYSLKSNLRGLPPDQVPNRTKVLKRGWFYFLPIIVLVYIVGVLQWSAISAAFISFFMAIVLGILNKQLKIKRLYEILVRGVEDALSIIVVGAAAGIVVGAVSYSGLGVKLGYIVSTASFGIIALALIYVALITTLLGMGIPTTPAYITAVAVSVPALASMGLDTFPVHFFVFWYAVLGAITPPVALASYAAASLAKADTMKTAVVACKLGFAAFILPFIMIFKPEIFLGYGNYGAMERMWSIITSLIATYAIATAFEGFIKRNLNTLFRTALMISGLALFAPTNIFVDLVAFTIIMVIIAMNYLRRQS